MLKCSICGICTNDAETALKEGWLPYFFEGAEEKGPCCPDCFDALLYVDKDGEPKLKDRFKGKLICADAYEMNQNFESSFSIVYN